MFWHGGDITYPAAGMTRRLLPLAEARRTQRKAILMFNNNTLCDLGALARVYVLISPQMNTDKHRCETGFVRKERKRR
jgi:hypothetical protein